MDGTEVELRYKQLEDKLREQQKQSEEDSRWLAEEESNLVSTSNNQRKLRESVLSEQHQGGFRHFSCPLLWGFTHPLFIPCSYYTKNLLAKPIAGYIDLVLWIYICRGNDYLSRTALQIVLIANVEMFQMECLDFPKLVIPYHP